jgi:hypothetical protein
VNTTDFEWSAVLGSGPGKAVKAMIQGTYRRLILRFGTVIVCAKELGAESVIAPGVVS